MKGFSDEERDRIRGHLLEEGRALFARFGLERTRIKDITEAVGIGTSTFYQFFDSKEQLYAEVLIRERDCLDETIAESIADVDSPREQVRLTLRTLLEEVETNPLVHRFVVDGELHSLQDRLSDDEKRALSENIRERDFKYAEEWTDHPTFRYDDPTAISSLFRMLIFVSQCKDAFPVDDCSPQYEETRDLLIDVVVDGLFAD
ncbi:MULTISPECIES: TetR/AcrR family transcriptional regulator [Natrialba]|uniref:TetR/AcrR family transcriptional regulator n=1 Tax=Natrialba swarupiae TaxID=2448032 RepID=A0A5D5AKW6_9EURY|nr:MULTISPECIES: TetR/AcrR family transcriptional regulator [Natrialba]MWV40586.1 TetR family transcriptional regulator [Natrialba sp. INN-245]TYT61613.1 TetR/AcrR family transcriptional regulator [Natrialba swarupiae]